MAERDDRSRQPDERGSDSPGSWEAALQGRAGAEGGPRAERTPGTGKQPRQGSNRTETTRQASAERTHFEPGEAPSEQGEKDHPSPHVIAQHQQGAEPRSGSHAQGDRSEEAATRGQPRGTHARHGRQKLSGDRANRE